MFTTIPIFNGGIRLTMGFDGVLGGQSFVYVDNASSEQQVEVRYTYLAFNAEYTEPTVRRPYSSGQVISVGDSFTETLTLTPSSDYDLQLDSKIYAYTFSQNDTVTIKFEVLSATVDLIPFPNFYDSIQRGSNMSGSGGDMKSK